MVPCKIFDTRALQVMKATAIVSVFLLIYVLGLDSVLSTPSQDKEVDSKIRSTTTCMGLGHMSESEANARLLSDGNNITQQCEQVIESDDGNDLTSNNYATNEVKVDDEKAEEDGNQVNQQSKQKIDD